MQKVMDKYDRGETLTREDRDEFDAATKEFDSTEKMLKQTGTSYDGIGRGIGIGGNAVATHIMSNKAASLAASNSHLVGRDTHDLPEWRAEGDKRGPVMLEARHDLVAYYSQSPDWNPTGIDMGSFDRNAFYRQLMTRNTAGREYRALSEGAQSVTVTGAGVTVPIAFAQRILELLRANLVFTSADASGTINGPTVIDMPSQIMVIPTWSADAANVGYYLGENTQLTPGTASLGYTKAQAWTAASIQLASRQAIEDSDMDLANLVEMNTALALSRTMDQAALYGTGSSAYQPAGILTSAYSSNLLSVSMGTNGAAPTNYNQVSQAVEKVRVANDEPTAIFTNPQVFGTYSRLNIDAYGKYYDVPQDVQAYWPPKYSTAFSATETQGSSSAASSALVLNANRVLMPLRQGLTFQILQERYSDYLQFGFLAYVRHDWQFPYASASCRLQGVLTT
jgi:HK97 family phage major capsid protein